MNVWSAQCQGHRWRQHRTEHKEHPPSPRIEMKISDPAGNQTPVGTQPTTPRRETAPNLKYRDNLANINGRCYQL